MALARAPNAAMSSTPSDDIATPELPASSTPPRAPEPSESSKTGWIPWIFSIFSRSDAVSAPESPSLANPLEESDIFSNWDIILSQDDQLYATKVKVERSQRQNELHAIAQQKRARSRSKEDTYQRLFSEPFLSAEELQHCKNPLDPNARSAIISKLVQWHTSAYLATLETLLAAEGPLDPAVWTAFLGNFHEQKYSKGIIGSMKDIAVLIYHGVVSTGLNGKILHQIVVRWTDILSKAFMEVAQRDIEPDEIEAIQKVVAESIAGPLIKLHIDIAKRSDEAMKRSGRLPSKWAEEDRARRAHLTELKRTGAVDARYEGHQKWTPQEISVPEGNHRAAAARLESTLVFRIALPPKPKTQPAVIAPPRAPTPPLRH